MMSGKNLRRGCKKETIVNGLMRFVIKKIYYNNLVTWEIWIEIEKKLGVR